MWSEDLWAAVMNLDGKKDYIQVGNNKPGDSYV